MKYNMIWNNFSFLIVRSLLPLHTSLNHLFYNCDVVSLKICYFSFVWLHLNCCWFKIHLPFPPIVACHKLPFFSYMFFKHIKFKPQNNIFTFHKGIKNAFHYFSKPVFQHLDPQKLCSPNLLTFGCLHTMVTLYGCHNGNCSCIF
jgi:hypothetical protein